jgi:ATP-binding cassette, subfamily B, bacterial CvaB/MchF/RaxB
MKSLLDRLSFGFGPRLPLLLQTEAAECGLACVGMVAGFHGYNSDLGTLRRRFPISLKGVTLATLVRVANQLGLMARPVKLDLEDMDQLRLPCVLHWEFSHFVVLKEVRGNSFIVHDPAFGIRELSSETMGNAFTGVALELWPSPEFKKEDNRRRVRLRDLVGQVSGLHRSLVQVAVLALALEVVTLVSPIFQQWVIDDVIVAADRELLTTLALGFGLLMIVQQTINAVRGWVLMYMGTMVNIQWHANVFTRLLQLPVAYFEKRHLGDIVSRFGSIDVFQRTLTTSFIEAVLDGVMTLVTLILMFVYSAVLAWIAVAAMALYGLGRWLLFRPMRSATEDRIVYEAKQDTHFFETVRGIKIIKLFGRQDERRSTWLTLLIDQVNADLRLEKLMLFYRSLNGTLFGIENILIIWLGARFVIDGNFSVGLLIAFLAYKGQFDSRVSSLIDKVINVQMLQIQAERLADIVLTEPEQLQGGKLNTDRRDLPATVEVRNLRFRYAEQEPYVLNGVSISVGAGESVAIVGKSGGGKTTLLNIILGVFEPTEGEVLIGGQRLSDLGLDAMREMIGTVLQDDALFSGSIGDNITFFDPHADEQWMEECAALAAVHDDIVAMPMGYNSLVGDMGTVLSGGQKQRVLMARALYKRPKILLLDEATSHLDVQREAEVNASIRSLRITRIIVAHRPETIACADRVVALVDGAVAEHGVGPAAPSGEAAPA